jgi:hypothetical protein
MNPAVLRSKVGRVCLKDIQRLRRALGQADCGSYAAIAFRRTSSAGALPRRV